MLAVTLVSSAPLSPASAAGPDVNKPAEAEAAKVPEKAPPKGLEGDGKKATEMLFDAKHIVNVPAGTELVYKFNRAPSDEKLLGKAFTDDIKVKVESDAAAGKKNVLVSIYTGERAREPNRITDMDGNPMLIVYLDNALGHFRQLAGGDRAYLKNQFSKSIGNQPKITPVKITYKGAEVEGQSVTVTPFADDPSRAKMRGYEGAEFKIVISDKIPGQFARMTSSFSNSQKDAPTLTETTTLDGVGDVK
ncbi:MAG: hypothetical protein HOP09_10585 [Hyphomicrobium sp.]|nr:hypothetical protein [Hyphomicrobium sp.]